MENRRGGEIIGAVVVFFILLFVYTKIAGPVPFYINSVTSTKTDSFQVQGTGKTAGAPDKSLINIGVTQESADVLDAQKKTNEASNRIISALKAMGVEEKNIKTVGYSISP